MKTCKCGRSIYQRPNSTIIKKLCPTCELKAVQSENKPFKQSFRTMPGQSVAKDKTGLKKAKNKSYYMKLADLWFSRYVRVKHSVNVGGDCYCKDIITGKLYAAKNIDNGHYFSRSHMATRYDEDNCRPQNRSSNRFRGESDKEQFRVNLIKEIGQERFDEMESRSRQTVNFCSADDLWKLAETYKQKVKNLLIEKGVKKWW